MAALLAHHLRLQEVSKVSESGVSSALSFHVDVNINVKGNSALTVGHSSFSGPFSQRKPS